MEKLPSLDLIALHGFTGCGDDFTGFSKYCSPCIHWEKPDLPGHGASSLLPCSPDSVLNFLDSLAKALKTPRVLLGYSMGARAAMLHASKYPDFWDALVLISPNPGIECFDERVARSAKDEEISNIIESEGVSEFLKFWQAQPLIRSQRTIRASWREEMAQNRKKHSAHGLAASLRGFGPAACPNLWPQIAKIESPVLIVVGECDQKYRAISDRILGTCPDASRLIAAGVGHAPHLESPEVVAAALDSFLKVTVPARGTL